jgi:hypothetical protein
VGKKLFITGNWEVHIKTKIEEKSQKEKKKKGKRKRETKDIRVHHLANKDSKYTNLPYSRE